MLVWYFLEMGLAEEGREGRRGVLFRDAIPDFSNWIAKLLNEDVWLSLLSDSPACSGVWPSARRSPSML